MNCGAIPVELVENELFGHERGAFTDASTAQGGLIHEAEGGTLFLDEIACLPLLAQVKLLRFLQDKEYRRLGSTKTQQGDVRVVAAMNIDLEEAVREGKLRQDLYYRLNIIPLVLPPLRERREDIPLLARYFLAKYAARLNKDVTDCSPDVMQLLVLYEWPGNVRELEHTIERAVLMCRTGEIQPADLSLNSPRAQSQNMEELSLEAVEAVLVRKALQRFQGNVSQAAEALGLSRGALYRRMEKYGV